MAYREDYCQEVIDFLAEGYSLTAFAGHIKVSRQTVWNWTKAHPEFDEAVQIGSACAVLWWEKAQRHLATTGEGNATACVFGLKNRAPEDWRDVNRIEHSGSLTIGTILDALPDG